MQNPGFFNPSDTNIAQIPPRRSRGRPRGSGRGRVSRRQNDSTSDYSDDSFTPTSIGQRRSLRSRPASTPQQETILPQNDTNLIEKILAHSNTHLLVVPPGFPPSSAYIIPKNSLGTPANLALLSSYQSLCAFDSSIPSYLPSFRIPPDFNVEELLVERVLLRKVPDASFYLAGLPTDDLPYLDHITPFAAPYDPIPPFLGSHGLYQLPEGTSIPNSKEEILVRWMNGEESWGCEGQVISGVIPTRSEENLEGKGASVHVLKQVRGKGHVAVVTKRLKNWINSAKSVGGFSWGVWGISTGDIMFIDEKEFLNPAIYEEIKKYKWDGLIIDEREYNCLASCIQSYKILDNIIERHECKFFDHFLESQGETMEPSQTFIKTTFPRFFEFSPSSLLFHLSQTRGISGEDERFEIVSVPNIANEELKHLLSKRVPNSEALEHLKSNSLPVLKFLLTIINLQARLPEIEKLVRQKDKSVIVSTNMEALRTIKNYLSSLEIMSCIASSPLTIDHNALNEPDNCTVYLTLRHTRPDFDDVKRIIFLDTSSDITEDKMMVMHFSRSSKQQIDVFRLIPPSSLEEKVFKETQNKWVIKDHEVAFQILTNQLKEITGLEEPWESLYEPPTPPEQDSGMEHEFDILEDGEVAYDYGKKWSRKEVTIAMDVFSTRGLVSPHDLSKETGRAPELCSILTTEFISYTGQLLRPIELDMHRIFASLMPKKRKEPRSKHLQKLISSCYKHIVNIFEKTVWLRAYLEIFPEDHFPFRLAFPYPLTPAQLRTFIRECIDKKINPESISTATGLPLLPLPRINDLLDRITIAISQEILSILMHEPLSTFDSHHRNEDSDTPIERSDDEHRNTSISDVSGDNLIMDNGHLRPVVNDKERATIFCRRIIEGFKNSTSIEARAIIRALRMPTKPDWDSTEMSKTVTVLSDFGISNDDYIELRALAVMLTKSPDQLKAFTQIIKRKFESGNDVELTSRPDGGPVVIHVVSSKCRVIRLQLSMVEAVRQLQKDGLKVFTSIPGDPEGWNIECDAALLALICRVGITKVEMAAGLNPIKYPYECSPNRSLDAFLINFLDSSWVSKRVRTILLNNAPHLMELQAAIVTAAQPQTPAVQNKSAPTALPPQTDVPPVRRRGRPPKDPNAPPKPPKDPNAPPKSSRSPKQPKMPKLTRSLMFKMPERPVRFRFVL